MQAVNLQTAGHLLLLRQVLLLLHRLLRLSQRLNLLLPQRKQLQWHQSNLRRQLLLLHRLLPLDQLLLQLLWLPALRFNLLHQLLFKHPLQPRLRWRVYRT